MDVDSILHIDCKHENLGANDNDLIKTDSNRVPVFSGWLGQI
jgi:hypothetical protein